MTPRYIYMASGRAFDIPLSDPIVATHLAKESSYVDTLLHQINEEKIYAPLFENRHGLTFLDIGANIGLVSIYAASACKRIVAVEPSEPTFSVLHAMTHKFPNIECFRGALAPNEGEVVFYENDLNTTASSTVNTYGTQTKVPGYRLTDLLRIHQLEKVDVVKCDAEGAEGESLTLEELYNAADIVEAYFIETHNDPKTTWQFKLGRIVEYLSRLGYHHQQINGMTLLVRK